MADQVVWSTPAMCMVPSANTAKEGKYVTTAGRVKFDVGQSGLITFLTAVTVPLKEDTYHLRALLERQSPDLFSTSIALRRARLADGAVSTLLECSKVQSGQVTNNVRTAISDEEKFAIDLDSYFYWVQVDDVEHTPFTRETVKATVGVSLVRTT
jgi:hypothetical protein